MGRVMKLYLHTNTTNVKEYTLRLIQRILAPYLVGTAAEADAVLLSLCDITELGDVVAARKYGKPIIAGGMVSEYPIVNELADYVWHGEIYGFRDCLLAGMTLDEMSSMTTRARRSLVIDQRIAWSENPIIKVGHRAMYYYTAKGCPLRCKYCYIGNVRDYQTVPESRYRQALKAAGKNLMPIAAFNPYGIPDGANIGETLLKKYVKGDQGARAKMIRSGVEFVTPDLSQNLAKGVTIQHVNEALSRSKAEKTKMILYFVAGLESQEQLVDFLSGVALDYATMPAVNVVFTYLDPQPFTPLHDFNLRHKVTGIDTKALYRVVSERNKRVRVLPLAGPEKSTVRTLLGRCESRADYEFVRGISRVPYAAMLERCDQGRGRLLGAATLEEVCARPRKATVPAYWSGA